MRLLSDSSTNATKEPNANASAFVARFVSASHRLFHILLVLGAIAVGDMPVFVSVNPDSEQSAEVTLNGVNGLAAWGVPPPLKIASMLLWLAVVAIEITCVFWYRGRSVFRVARAGLLVCAFLWSCYVTLYISGDDAKVTIVGYKMLSLILVLCIAEYALSRAHEKVRRVLCTHSPTVLHDAQTAVSSVGALGASRNVLRLLSIGSRLLPVCVLVATVETKDAVLWLFHSDRARTDTGYLWGVFGTGSLHAVPHSLADFNGLAWLVVVFAQSVSVVWRPGRSIFRRIWVWAICVAFICATVGAVLTKSTDDTMELWNADLFVLIAVLGIAEYLVDSAERNSFPREQSCDRTGKIRRVVVNLIDAFLLGVTAKKNRVRCSGFSFTAVAVCSWSGAALGAWSGHLCWSLLVEGKWLSFLWCPLTDYCVDTSYHYVGLAAGMLGAFVGAYLGSLVAEFTLYKLCRLERSPRDGQQ